MAPRRRRAASWWRAAIWRLLRSAAKFATPGVNIGLFCSTPMVALSRNVSRKHAMEMLLTGELISAEDAARIGLVNHVVAPGHERDEALKLGEKIAAKSTLTVKIGKEAFYRQAEMPLAEAYRICVRSDGREHAGARRRGRHLRPSSRNANRNGKTVES